MSANKFKGTGRYDNMFNALKDENEGAFIPFVMLGDPDVETSLEIILALVEGGADALELGIPYSDPIADGPTIQQASIRALDSGVKPSHCMDIISKVREAYPDIPIGLLLYSNLVLAAGLDTFYKQASEAGVDSILIADVPIREVMPFMQIATAHNIHQIMIAPPNASSETLSSLAELSSGYTYLLGRAGVTGAETAATIPTRDLIEKLDNYGVAPPVLGFGISQPQQVSAAIEAGAAGAIAGSATVNIIAENLHDKALLTDKLRTFSREMKAATKR